MKKQLITIAVALLTAGVLTTSCSSEDNTIDTPQTQQPAGNTITLTATLAPKGDDGGTTRAITTGKDANSKEILNVAWKSGEEISIRYQKSDNSWARVKATVGTPNADGSAPFTATLTEAKDGATAKLIYPYSLANTDGNDIRLTNLKGQSGMLTKPVSGADNSISSYYDYALGTATIAVNGTEATVTGPVVMQNQVCICKFSFSGISSDATENYYWITFNITEGSTTTTYTAYNVKKENMQAVYMAMLPASNADIAITVQGYNKTSAEDTGTKKRTYNKFASGVTLEKGKFYRNFVVNLIYLSSTVVISDGDTYTLSGTTIDVTSGPAIRCEGDATIILNGTNTVTASAEGQPAIFIPEGKTLTIQGTGSLTATATGGGAAGIGGGYQGGTSYAGINCGNIIIESGTITATGIAAGIGSGNYGTCGTITINGGTVTATGVNHAGIGSGYYGTCGTITINGGTVTATGRSTGIGTGSHGTCGDININGGTVTATGGESAAGIGSGYQGTCDAISISGGNVTATGGEKAAGIGSGNNGSCGNITISGSANINATGGQMAAGIGSGFNGTCGTITISSGVISVTATKGEYALYSIGKGMGNNASCGTVTIGGTVYYDGSNFQNDGDTYLATSPLVYPAP